MSSDPALRGLKQALDPDRMLRFVAQAAGVISDDVAGLRCAPEVITHKPGRRCVIRYALSGSAVSPLAPPRPVFGKLYVSRRRATRMHEQTEALRRSGVPSIPACLMLIAPAHLVLQECVEGVDLGKLFESPEVEATLALAAQWLVRLHSAPPLPGLKQVSLSRSLEKADRWCSEIGDRLAAERPALGAARDALAAMAHGLPSCTPTMIHRDFYHAHVFWNGERIWILDFDELSVGDPALDVGHFLAQLEVEAHRQTGRWGSFAELGARFAEAYREAASADPGPRLPFYRAYTFLKLAQREATRQSGGWRSAVRDLVDLARRES